MWTLFIEVLTIRLFMPFLGPNWLNLWQIFGWLNLHSFLALLHLPFWKNLQIVTSDVFFDTIFWLVLFFELNFMVSTWVTRSQRSELRPSKETTMEDPHKKITTSWVKNNSCAGWVRELTSQSMTCGVWGEAWKDKINEKWK